MLGDTSVFSATTVPVWHLSPSARPPRQAARSMRVGTLRGDLSEVTVDASSVRAAEG